MRNPITLLVPILASTLALPAVALTIDDFEQGDFNVVDLPTPGPTVLEQSGLPSTNVVGGARLIRAIGNSGGTTTASLTTTGGPDGSALSYADASPPIGTGDVAFVYDGIGDGNINAINGALNLDLSAFGSINVLSSVAGSGGNLQLTLWSSTTVENSPLVPLANGTTSFLLASFGSIDLTDVKAIRLSILGLDPLNAPIIDDISAGVPVPEPGTALLIAAGLVGLGIRRTRSL